MAVSSKKYAHVPENRSCSVRSGLLPISLVEAFANGAPVRFTLPHMLTGIVHARLQGVHLVALVVEGKRWAAQNPGLDGFDVMGQSDVSMYLREHWVREHGGQVCAPIRE